MADVDPTTAAPPPPPTASPQAGPPADDNALMNQIMQMIMGSGMGGAPGGGFGGANPMAGMADALGLGGGGDPLAMGGLINPLGGNIGLNPYQGAKLRMMRNAKMNTLRQNMANQHRAIGPAGGSDFSRHVGNIDDEILANQEQMVQDNVKNALAYNQQLMSYGQQNLAQNQKLAQLLGLLGGNLFRYGGAGQDEGGSPGTFSQPQTDTQGA